MVEKIKVALVGLGNCFSGLIQGIEYYKKNPSQQVIGIIHDKLRDYSIHDIDFVAGFDVGENKVGKPVNEAIYESPNMVDWIPKEEMPKTSGKVYESPALDGVGIWVENKVKPIQSNKSESEIQEEIKKVIKETGTEIIVSYLPVGSEKATQFWANICLETNTAFVNCMPAFIASDKEWAQKFKDKNIPIIGDDIKGQVGATIVHRTLARLCDERGTKIEKTYQINVGGNTDFLNMKEQERLVSKRISKTESVQSQLTDRLDDEQIYVGPSDFIPFLGNTKLMFMRIEGRQWANIPYNMEVRLEVDDKANSAGIVIDAIRLAKIALDRGMGGPIIPASAYLMKHPIEQMTDPVAKTELEKFVSED
jgi:myo-inositol-1-phosphate synthase|tara:strand:- start:2193 stop:3287 length:1095 start_codon:yes stop_codon:yes gene_type:complete